MSYIDDSISSGEHLVGRARLSWVLFGWPIVLIILGIAIATRTVGFGLCVLFVGLVWAAGVYLKVRFSEFGVSNKRVIFKVGILSRRSVDILLQQVEAIEVEQSLIGRLFNYGKIVVIGSGGTRRPFTNISSPLKFKKTVEEQVTAKVSR
jgi:uncharacterized membrane protein YdbT with pleckstrin-like domain